jgi:hypothetical protein
MAPPKYGTLVLDDAPPLSGARLSKAVVAAGAFLTMAFASASLFVFGWESATSLPKQATNAAAAGQPAQLDDSDIADVVMPPQYLPDLPDRSDQPIVCREEGDMDRQSERFFDLLPRWSPVYDGSEAFHEACYYSYRCCVDIDDMGGCLQLSHTGTHADSCLSCLALHSPKMVRPACNTWLADCCTDYGAYDPDSGCGDTGERGTGGGWGLPDLLKDNGVPISNVPDYALMFSNFNTCWFPPGQDDPRQQVFAKQCHEVIQRCEFIEKVCPRDHRTRGHDMCQDCIRRNWTGDANALAQLAEEVGEGAATTENDVFEAELT